MYSRRAAKCGERAGVALVHAGFRLHRTLNGLHAAGYRMQRATPQHVTSTAYKIHHILYSKDRAQHGGTMGLGFPPGGGLSPSYIWVPASTIVLLDLHLTYSV